MSAPTPRLDLAAIGQLNFELPDVERFPALRLARAALARGGTLPTVLNAANEVAVGAFLADRIGFLDIAAVVEATLASCDCGKPEGLQHILAIDAAARRTAHGLIGRHPAVAAAGL
jgi:1-deoxy-D-xylulose-5-phosphate reductoisomerase